MLESHRWDQGEGVAPSTLARMAPVVVRHLAPGGRLVLSGLTPRQDSWVLNAYRRRGLVLDKRLVLDGWTTLMMRRAPRRQD